MLEAICSDEQKSTEELEKVLKDSIEESNKILREAYENYVTQIREEIKQLPRGSKKWWRLNGILLGRASKKTAAVPPLRDLDGEWVFENVMKADLLGTTFEAKSKLPTKIGSWTPEEKESRHSSFALLRVKKTAAILKDINIDKATGPDKLPGRILKMCADELAAPITHLARRMLAEGIWPDCWREHWVTPLYK